MPKHPVTQLLNGFVGLNNIHRPENTDPKYLKEASNVLIDTTNNIIKRKGYTKKIEGNVTSLWNSEINNTCYIVIDNSLSILYPNYTFNTITQVDDNKVSFIQIDNEIYYSSATYNGVIVNNINYRWGQDKVNPPNLQPSTGSLPYGTYMVSCTSINSLGIESGCKPSSIIQCSGGIQVDIPIVTDSVSIRVYISEPNGTDLYYYSTASPGSIAYIQSLPDTISPLRTAHLSPMPKGELVAYYKGRVYVASDNILYYSEPFQYHSIDLANNYIIYPTTITNICTVEDGIWVCSDNIYYLSGGSPDEFKQSLKERVQAVRGSELSFSGSYIKIDNTPVGYKWFITTNLGIFILFNQGLLINVTSDFLNLDRFIDSTSIFLQDEGMHRYVVMLKQLKNNANVSELLQDTDNTVLNNIINDGLQAVPKGSTEAAAAVTDEFTTTIIRNGIPLP